MGEIGIPRDQFLYTLKLWEVVSIRKGYERRICREWEVARFNAFCTVKSSMGGAPKIKTMQDLLRLPIDRDDDEVGEMPTDAEIERLQREMRKFNEQQSKPSE